MKKLILLAALLFLMAGVLVGAQDRDFFSADGVYWENLTPREKLILIKGFQLGIGGVLYVGGQRNEGLELCEILIKPWGWAANPDKLVKMLDEFYRQNRTEMGAAIEFIIMDFSGAGPGNPRVGVGDVRVLVGPDGRPWVTMP